MHLHIQCLWGVFSATDVPEMPTPAQITAFNRRFTTTDEWEAYYNTLSYNSTEALSKISALRRDATLRTKSPIARNIAAMDDHDLNTMFVGILSAGLKQWRPDLVGGTRESVYNRAHELVAIKTFQDCATNHAYVRLSPDLSLLNDRKVLQKLYRNCVWSLNRRKVVSELTLPGSVVARVKVTQDYKRRNAVTLISF